MLSGRETVRLVFNQKKAGKLKTKIKLTFTPKGREADKDRYGQVQEVDEMIRANNRSMDGSMSLRDLRGSGDRSRPLTSGLPRLDGSETAPCASSDAKPSAGRVLRRRMRIQSGVSAR